MKFKELKKQIRKDYKWHHRLYDFFFYKFIAAHHPKKVLSALDYDHPHVRDMYGTLLSDDVEPAREQIRDFQEYVECEAGDYVEIIVFNRNL